MKKLSFLFILITLFQPATHAQTNNWSEKMANVMIETHKDSITYKEEGKSARWDYEQAIILKAIEKVWYRTGDAKYFRFILNNMDSYVNDRAKSELIKENI